MDLIARALALALIAVIAALWMQTSRLQRLQLRAAEAQAEMAAAAASAAQAARAIEQAQALADAAIAESYERGKSDAQAAADRVVADLNAGTLRLRREWAGCETQRLSDAAAATRELDAAEQGRAASAGRIVRAAAECDAQVSALQALVRADRGGQL